MNALKELREYGQSIWLDYIRRSLLTGGELARLVEEDGLRGVTSNPTIFQKAIAGSDEYDEALAPYIDEDPEADVEALYEHLAIADIRQAADVLRPVYDETDGADGFVSLEVSPHLAYDTERTVAEARRLWQRVDRPNLMIKVPATPQGIPAIEQLIAEGINVNVTLMFSLEHYERVARAYLRGLERAAEPQRVASVASFFVSRVDTAVDHKLEELGTPEARALKGKIAIANAKRVYRRFQEIFHGEAFEALRAKGARAQRVLWASTGTKNPDYRDTLYVEELIGPETVNTVPPATLNAFRDHGRVRGATIEEGLEGALARLDQLEGLGIDLDEITEQLQREGVEKFRRSFHALLEALEEKRKAFKKRRVHRPSLALGGFEAPVRERLERWEQADFLRRLWRKDPTLWFPEPQPEIVDRLGWLELPAQMHEKLEALEAFADEVRTAGTQHVLLLGMGGSSLAPEVFQRTFGNRAGHPELLVLDSTHPDAIKAVEAQIDLEKTLFLVSSKSGTTVETLSLFRYFWERIGKFSEQPGDRFVAITDPETPLEELARSRGFRRVFRAPPDVGGRYSALSVFGLVPAALIGVDLHELLDAAWTVAEGCSFCVSPQGSDALALGAALGELARAGRDKLTLLTSPALEAFPDWLEQLIAESTGKDGRGIVPVVREPLGAPRVYGADRAFVYIPLAGDDEPALEERLKALEAAGHPLIRIPLEDVYDLGREMFRWELAVAAAGAVLKIHPFNQPDVELAKRLAREAMQAGGARAETHAIDVSDPDQLKAALVDWRQGARPGGYIALQAYLAPNAATTEALQALRVALRDQLQMATTLGYGPRFLHSTGQLHKGGPDTGLFLQLVDEPSVELPVPETEYTFRALIRAQAQGDSQALRQRGRRVLSLNLGSRVRAGLERLLEALA